MSLPEVVSPAERQAARENSSLVCTLETHRRWRRHHEYEEPARSYVEDTARLGIAQSLLDARDIQAAAYAALA